MIEILLVDDHPLVGEGTKMIIENEKDMNVQIETSSVRALERVKRQDFDVMLFDLKMPFMDGFELTKKVREIKPDSNVVIYTGFDFLPHIDMFIESGAIGFVSKTATKEQLIRAIRCAMEKEIVMPISFLRDIYPGKKNKEKIQHKDVLSISPREKEILQELIKGKTNKDIAQRLFIGQRSLEYNLTHLFHKLGVQTRVEAVVKAKELGLIDD